MSKKSRTFQPSASAGGQAAPTTATDGATTTPSGDVSSFPTTATPKTSTTGGPATTSRAAARRRAAASTHTSAEPSFFERYRVLILGGIAVALLAVGGVIIANMSAGTVNAYACDTLLTPGPSDPAPAASSSQGSAPAASGAPGASPVTAPRPEPTQRLGFTTEDMGRGHVAPSDKVDYAFCPPTSGKHFNIANVAPLARQFYPPATKLVPGNWVHNLEHGYVVLLYRGEITPAEQQTLQDIMAEATPSAFGASTCGYSKVIAVRFDDMDPGVDFAAVAWDRALLLPSLDKERLLTFVNQEQDGPQTPEPGLC